MLTPTQARAVLAELLEAAAGSVGAREAGRARLAAAAPGDLVRLDDNARTGWSWGGPPWTVLRLDEAELTEPTGLVAAVASMHPDGRVRQPAVRALAGRRGPLPAALLALRAVDHVHQVRDDAAAGLAAHPSVEEALAAVPVLLAVVARAHGPAALTGYTDVLHSHHGPRVLLELLDSSDRSTRRWAFTTCLNAGLLTTADLLRAAQDRQDQFVRRAAAEHVQLAGDAGPAALRTLLTGRYADGRVAALAGLPDRDLADDDLRAALLDRSARVRDTARWRARLHGVDVAAFYRRVLSNAGPDRPAAAARALLALVWVGNRADVPAIERRLADPRPAVRSAAVRALVARTELGEAAARLAPLLLDESPKVASTAARALALASPTVTRQAEQAAWASSQPWSRRAAWRLGRVRGGWDRVVADLRAAADGDADLAELGRSSLLDWLHTAAATTWQRPRTGQAEQLATHLAAAGLDPDTTRLVAFHAGLPREVDRPPAAAAREPTPPSDSTVRRWRSRLRWPR